MGFWEGVGQTVGDILGSIAGIFGYNPAKIRGIDYTNIMSYISKALTAPEMQAQNKLDGLTKKLDALLMMPLSGQMKQVVVKARNAVYKQKEKVNNTINKASVLRNEAENLASDLSNSTAGDFWTGRASGKESRLKEVVEQAKDELSGLKDEISDYKENK